MRHIAIRSEVDNYECIVVFGTKRETEDDMTPECQANVAWTKP